MTTSTLRKQRARLFAKQGGKCFWCGVAMILPSDDMARNEPLMATIDHLVNKLSPLRGRIRGDAHVVACFSCNQRRGREETAQAIKDGRLTPAGRKSGLTTRR